MSLDLHKAENEGFPMRYMTSLYLKYFLRKLPKTVEICLKKSRPAGYFFVGVYVVSSKNLSCKSFKIRVNFWIEVLRIYRIMLATSFLDNFHPLSMRCSLNLQLRSAHERPQQPNRPDSPIDANQFDLFKWFLEFCQTEVKSFRKVHSQLRPIS